MEEKGLIKLAESLDLSRLEDECIILDDEKADDIYGGKFVCCRIEFAFVEQRLAADERGGLPLAEADFRRKSLILPTWYPSSVSGYST